MQSLVCAPVLRAPPTSPPGRRPARPRRDGSCTPRSARSRCPRSPSPGSGTRPPCYASTAGTVISPPWSPRASAGRKPMCSTRFPRASPRRSSEGSTTSLRTGWPRLWTGWGPAVSSTPPAGSATPAGRPRSGSSRSPTTLPRRRTPAWSRASSTSSSQTSSPSPQRSTPPAPGRPRAHSKSSSGFKRSHSRQRCRDGRVGSDYPLTAPDGGAEPTEEAR